MLTPVQIASLLATIADDGCWSPPQLVKYTLDGSGQMRQLDTVPGEQVIRWLRPKNTVHVGRGGH
jgi:peptidoglycan glycosyltransferase/penicillin-binding protein 2